MIDLYPFQLVPEFVERVWGTHDVSFLYQHSVGAKPIGEVWLTGDQNRIANGHLKGRTLADVAQQYGSRLIGERSCASGVSPDRFPLLMKVLFPREKLSVQVHPDDVKAQEVGEPCGKTECWYILKSDPGAQIGLGFLPGTQPDEIERSIHENRMEHLLNWIDVSAGEMYYVDAGTVHAIAPGSVIVETQQNSDTTYRLYDYGRPRELHIERGMAAMKTLTHAGRTVPQDETLVASPCFVVERLTVNNPRGIHTDDNAHCLFALSGAVRIEADGTPPITISRGEVAVVPANLPSYHLVPQWNAEIMLAHLPSTTLEEPQTEMPHAMAGKI
ncbi:MAG: class I mannose-6-phosphate isomerase [Acidobacteriaceae bacterium]